MVYIDGLKMIKTKILELIKIKDKVSRGDLQGMAETISMRIAPADWEMQNDISNRILIIVDNSQNFNDVQLDHHIKNLERDIKNYR